MRVGARFAASLALTLWAVLGASAQEAAISGVVLDAGSGQPIAGAVLLLRPAPARPAPGAPDSAPSRPTRSARSDSTGSYRFGRVAPGAYELRTERLGYRGVVLGVEVAERLDAKVSVGLNILPIKLEPVTASPGVSNPFAVRDTDSPEREARGRAAAERTRLDQSLSVDVETLTRGAVTEAITLAEPDLFRALQRSAAVTARDDLSAELWTRGARGDLTRVYFDGVPLFDPHHAFGVLAAVSPDAVGAVYLHPGVAPVALGEGAAGVVDLRSRRGGGQRSVRGVGELSIIAARAALDQQLERGDLAWMVAGRRSHIDWLSEAAAPDSALPYSFSDLTARVDVALDANRSLEIAGTRLANVVAGEFLGEPEPLLRRWGSGVGRGTLDLPLAGGRLRTTGAFTRSSYRDAGEVAERANRGAVAMMLLRGEWAISLDSMARWSAGAELASQESAYRGVRLIRTERERPDSLTYSSSRILAGAWLTHRWRPAARLTVEGMLRADASRGAGFALLLAPRGAARFQLAPGLQASLAAGQSFQHTQTIAPGAPGLRSEPRAQLLWLLAGDTIPRVRSRVATAGVEYANSRGWLASVAAFVRGIDGLVLADPTPGELLGRPSFVVGASRAHGFEASVRRLSARWTTHGAYSYGRSTTVSGAYRYLSPEHRTHALDLTTLLRVGRSIRWGGAYTTMSGSPFTPYVPPVVECGAPAPCRWIDPPVLGAPGSGRGPLYSSLDVLADWSGRIRGIHVGAYLQIHNVLDHDNRVTYSRECAGCGEADGRRFRGGVGRAPMVGVRAAF